MTDDLRPSIGYMRGVVAALREIPGLDGEDRDTLVRIIEEQIREMEWRQGVEDE